ncbi:MurR/RpiR family transcriptional regulator [Microbacterium sp. YY-03]|uniref:MurR/RpiR family transcriptional regulator n=1 Tax=Microbacterium sp. YY-03 TaxID=3421636 RepID=UPI003D17BF2D
MSWTGAIDAKPSVRMAALAPDLLRTERLVVDAIAQDRGKATELTAQELAEWAGVGRTTVIRAAQALGYEGYSQLRVALVQELASESSAPVVESDASSLGVIRGRMLQVGSRLEHTLAVLTPEAIDSVLDTLDTADRVLVVGNGLSGPLAMALVMRLNAAGRSVEYFADPIAQQIAAKQLGAGSALFVLSGSGASRPTLEVMNAAQESGARVIAVTSFARSAVAKLADVPLVMPPTEETFHDELIHTSRGALMLFLEELVDLFVERRGERGRIARQTAISMLGRAIAD